MTRSHIVNLCVATALLAGCSDAGDETAAVPEETSEAREARLAADATKTHFTIMGTPMAIPVPAGYCKVMGEDAQTAQQEFDLDEANYTIGHFIGCDDQGVFDTSRYILIKSPRDHPGQSVEKEASLAELAAFMGSDTGASQMQDAIGGATDAIAARGGDSPRINATAFNYAGRDADCVYLSGEIAVTNAQNNGVAMAATCITVAQNKLLSVNIYDTNQAGQSADELKQVARAIGNTAVYDDERFP